MAPLQEYQEKVAHQNSQTRYGWKVAARSTAEMGVYVHGTTLSHTLHRVAQKNSHCIKEKNVPHLELNTWKKVHWSDKTKMLTHFP